MFSFSSIPNCSVYLQNHLCFKWMFYCWFRDLGLKSSVFVGSSRNYAWLVCVLVNCLGVLLCFLLGVVCHSEDGKILRTAGIRGKCGSSEVTVKLLLRA